MITRPTFTAKSFEELATRVDTFQRTVVAAFKQLFSRNKAGLVPPPGGSGSRRFLCEDGEWREP